MGGVAIEDWSVTLGNLSWVVQYNNLSKEVGCVLGWIILGVRSDESSSEIFDSEILHVEADVVSRFCFF